MSKKSILFSISYYAPYVSGLSICAQRVADNLAVDQEVNILCMRHDKNLPEIEYNIWRANPLFKIGKGFISIDWLSKSWFLVKGADVVVVNLPQFEGFVPALMAKITGKKVVSIVHCEVTLKNKLLQIILDKANILSMVLSDKIVVYTMDYAENSRWIKYFKTKLVEIYPPILEVKAIGTRSLGNRAKNKLTLGVAARLAEEKGFEYLFKAMKLLNTDVQLLVAGPIDPVGENNYKNKIFKLIKNLNINVKFLGSLNQTELQKFYKQIDMLILPSVNSTEAFGLVQVEAMFCGTPVVASNLPGVRIPILKTGMGELAKPKNAKDLAKAIIKVHKTKYKNTARKIFDPKESYEKYRTVILS